MVFLGYCILLCGLVITVIEVKTKLTHLASVKHGMNQLNLETNKKRVRPFPNAGKHVTEPTFDERRENACHD